MRLVVKESSLHRIELSTRMPFKYGIATMTDLPHVILRVAVDTGSRITEGWSGDCLPPKWFTKVPEKDPLEEVQEMIEVIVHAMNIGVGLRAGSVFDLWWQLYEGQMEWGEETGLPPLLTHFGVSLVERAVIDAVCRAEGSPFHRLLKQNAFRIDLGKLFPELAGSQPSDFLPNDPLSGIACRHTVGLADPIVDEDVDASERLDDGLPQSLAASVRRYGLRELKIKISGDIERDAERLNEILVMAAAEMPGDYRFSLDGNEQFLAASDFAAAWSSYLDLVRNSSFWRRLVFIEQPVHREHTFEAPMPEILDGAGRAVPVIIDESDGRVGSLAEALALGYAGVSHKNCKGICKGAANRCLVTSRAKLSTGVRTLMTGEDLGSIGPVSMVQDLAVQAAFGISSVERNGHHYFAGLSQLPHALQQQALVHLPAMYHRSEEGWPALAIHEGMIDVSDVNAAPFGVPFNPDLSDGYHQIAGVG